MSFYNIQIKACNCILSALVKIFSFLRGSCLSISDITCTTVADTAIAKPFGTHTNIAIVLCVTMLIVLWAV